MLDTDQEDNSCEQQICIQRYTSLSAIISNYQQLSAIISNYQQLSAIISNMEWLSHVCLGLSQDTERPKGKAKLSKPLEGLYLVLPFPLVRLDLKQKQIFCFPPHISNSEQCLDAEHSSSNLDDRQSPPRSSTVLKSSFVEAHASKEICKICSNILLEY